jgi:hypothetical protein
MVEGARTVIERTHVKTLLFATLVLPALVILAGCGGGDDSTGNGSGEDTSSERTRTATPIGQDGDEDGGENGDETPSGPLDPLATVCRDNPDPANDDEVQVEAPLGGDPVTSPVTVRGEVAAFEATFKITIYDAAGATIADVTGMSSEGQTLAPFSEDVPFSVSQETDACLWVYESSARDGSPTNVVQVPIRLQP